MLFSFQRVLSTEKLFETKLLSTLCPSAEAYGRPRFGVIVLFAATLHISPHNLLLLNTRGGNMFGSYQP